MAAAMSCSAFTGKALRPAVSRSAAPKTARLVTPRAAAVSADVPDMNKRNIVNLMLLGAVGLPVASLAGPFALFFVPPS
jgi:cytochrome b6-f complex iron-sulfur subunit